MDLVIESVEDLKQFSAYIAYKLKSIEKNINRRDTAVDAIFKEAVKEFRLELISNEPHLQVIFRAFMYVFDKRRKEKMKKNG